MAHAVFIQNPISIYNDIRGEVYHFPKRYLGMVHEAVGDFVVFYESRKGAFGYVSIQKVLDVVPDPEKENHYFAILDRSSEWTFEHVVPRAAPDGRAIERSLRGSDDRPISGGVSVSAVRRLSEQEFTKIFTLGMTELTGPEAMPRVEIPETEMTGFAEGQAVFEHAPLAGIRPEVLMSRKYRDPSFAR